MSQQDAALPWKNISA